jgi:subtilisin-like proprotein convertase family protein
VSRIVVDEDARIQRLMVTVDILHSYIGDLMVYLVAPNGYRVVLHNREGGRSENLLATFDATSVPELMGLNGVSVRGVWSLEVADYARLDEGNLRQWTLVAVVEDDGSIRAESHPSQLIPDNDPNGISDRILISHSRNISQIQVEVEITHTWIGDLRVMLTGPSGEQAILHDRSGTNAVNIQRVFDMASAPDLNRFLNQDARGEWTLSVSDHAGQDSGKLNRWGIRIH